MIRSLAEWLPSVLGQIPLEVPPLQARRELDRDFFSVAGAQFKTELIADRVWRTRGQLELAIVEWVSWLNNDRLHESLGDWPPVRFENSTLCDDGPKAPATPAHID